MAENKIRLRTSIGDIGILHGHQPLTTTLDYGFLRIINGEDEIKATIFGGFASVDERGITVLSDAAEWPEEIDEERAIAAKERAENRKRTLRNFSRRVLFKQKKLIIIFFLKRG